MYLNKVYMTNYCIAKTTELGLVKGKSAKYLFGNHGRLRSTMTITNARISYCRLTQILNRALSDYSIARYRVSSVSVIASAYTICNQVIVTRSTRLKRLTSYGLQGMERRIV